MDNSDFVKLVELLEQESSARIASEAKRTAENAAFQQMTSKQNLLINQLHETIGALLEENRLLKGPKKNSGNSSIPLPKMKTGLQEQVVYARLVESLLLGKRGTKDTL